MGDEDIFIEPELSERFAVAFRRCRVIFISAPCGCGKTTQAAALLRGHSTDSRSAYESDCLSRPIEPTCEVVVIDDFQMLSPADAREGISDIIASREDLRVVLLSRGVVPGWLMPFQLAGVMQVFSHDDLLLGRNLSKKMLESYGIVVSELDMVGIHQGMQGYPVALRFLVSRMEGGKPYCNATLDAVKRDIFRYFDETVYHRFERPMRNLLLCLAPFEAFTAEMAKSVSGDSAAGELVGCLASDTTMLEMDGLGTYRFRPIFRQFLIWKVSQEYSIADERALYERAGQYYESQDDIVNALECYTKSENVRRVSALLERHAVLHPGVGHYYETERFYRALPREEVLRSPTLICGMSMLCAMTLDFEGSDGWHDELRTMARSLKKSEAEYREARSMLAYLDVALPQQGVAGLTEIITGLFTVLRNKEVELPAFSVTSTLPSIMNGGKDFCEWSKKDDLMYATMRKPVEALLGRDGVGLADCAICESKFEKGVNVSAQLLSLVARLGEIQSKGTPDIEFAVVGLLAREQIIQGKADAARMTVSSLRERFLQQGCERFIPNIDALLCRIDLRLGNDDLVEEWFREDAPKDALNLKAMWRYRYLTLAMVDLYHGNPENALVALAPLLTYCRKCARVMDAIYIRLLTAICRYRMDDASWREMMCELLEENCDYKFIVPIAQFGAAILPLLTECGWQGNATYLRKVVAATREQAVQYPRFLESAPALAVPLSDAEMQVLKLLCHNMSNREIGEILGIKLATVKTHVSHIFQKLGASRRSEAREMAEKLKIV